MSMAWRRRESEREERGPTSQPVDVGRGRGLAVDGDAVLRLGQLHTHDRPPVRNYFHFIITLNSIIKKRGKAHLPAIFGTTRHSLEELGNHGVTHLEVVLRGDLLQSPRQRLGLLCCCTKIKINSK
jgi:hypothetical protein